MTVSAQYARDHFDELLIATDNGEEVEVSREGKPSIKLFVMPTPAQNQVKGERKLGMGRGTLMLTDEQWQQMKEEDERYYANLPLMTTGEM